MISFQNDKDFFPHINPSIFMQPGGDKFVQVLCYLASHVLRKNPQCSEFLLPPTINSSSSSTKPSSFCQQYQLNTMKGTACVLQKGWKSLFETFGQKYQSRKELAKLV